MAFIYDYNKERTNLILKKSKIHDWDIDLTDNSQGIKFNFFLKIELVQK